MNERRFELWEGEVLVGMLYEYTLDFPLINPDDPSMIAGFVLHIDGKEAWFRYRKKKNLTDRIETTD